ncbi:MAG: cyclophilin-like fold protein [Thermoproteota archaeon]
MSLEFSELGEKVAIELDDFSSPETVRTIIDNLPIIVTINRWGDELYTDETPIHVKEENAKSVVNLMDVAYWPEGRAFCFFYGPTPVSKPGRIMPYSPVNIIGRILTKPADIQKLLSSIEKLHTNKNVPVVLH